MQIEVIIRLRIAVHLLLSHPGILQITAVVQYISRKISNEWYFSHSLRKCHHCLHPNLSVWLLKPTRILVQRTLRQSASNWRIITNIWKVLMAPKTPSRGRVVDYPHCKLFNIRFSTDMSSLIQAVSCRKRFQPCYMPSLASVHIPLRCYEVGSLGSSVGIASTLRAGRPRSPGYITSNSKSFFFSSPWHSDRLWATPSLLYNWYLG
jgi:hypothetical protein